MYRHEIYFVYVVFCGDGSYYVGITNDVERRVWEWSRRKKSALARSD